jgi:uncharacterized LabA/DUF88 family protein
MLFKIREIILGARDYFKHLFRIKKRVAILVDGFNLYHSLSSANAGLYSLNSLKWFDIRAYCQSKLHIIGRHSKLHHLLYFSALAGHKENINKGTIQRHREFIKAIESTGFDAVMGNFKKKNIVCTSCSSKMRRHEEKETDVNISIKLLELAIYDHADIIVVMSGDTDLIPAIKNAKRLAPEKEYWVIFPHGRFNNEIKNLPELSGYIKMKHSEVARYQFEEVIQFSDGGSVSKPSSW